MSNVILGPLRARADRAARSPWSSRGLYASEPSRSTPSDSAQYASANGGLTTSRYVSLGTAAKETGKLLWMTSVETPCAREYTAAPRSALLPRSDLIPARPRRSLLVVWGLFAALNLSAGLFIAAWPERQTDLETLGRWGREWLAGVNIYATETPDYPPHAIVVFSPIGLLSPGVAVRIWAALNLGLAVLAPYLAVRIARPDARPAAMTLPVLMCLSWGGFRTLLQFSLLTLVRSARDDLSDRRRALSGLSLGLALMKPQMNCRSCFGPCLPAVGRSQRSRSRYDSLGSPFFVCRRARVRLTYSRATQTF